MGEHTRVLTHEGKVIVSRNVNVKAVQKELLATHDQWLTWFVVNKSMNTSVQHKSYAEVLQNGNPVVKSGKKDSNILVHNCVRSVTSTPQRIANRYSDCVQSKCVPFKRNAKPSVSSGNYQPSKGNAVMQESPFELSNRFQVLASAEDILIEQHVDAQHDIPFDFELECNKNKTGPILGQEPCKNASTTVYVSKVVRGNKNKTGKNWVLPH